MATATSSKPTEHLLNQKLLDNRVKVVVVGCGGTGSAVAAALPYLHQAMIAHGHPHGLMVTLCDADKISETNCVRQPFSQSEIGLCKSIVLMNRINMFWGLGWNAIPDYVDERWTLEADIVIGCVDTREARGKISRSQMCVYSDYWLDIGNNADSGQFILGQPDQSKIKREDWYKRRKQEQDRLPTVADLYPEIIDGSLDKTDKLPSCSAVEALNKQEPFVNQTLAYHAMALLARLFRHGRISHHGGFINLATGRMSALPVNPDTWQQIQASHPVRRAKARR